MRSVATVLFSLVLMVVVAMPLAAQEKAKKGKKKGGRQAGAATMLLKKLEKAELTEEQVKKIKEMAAAVKEKLDAARAKAALTDDQKAAMKKAREDGKKNEEVQAVAKLTDEQKAALKVSREIQMELNKKVMALLTPEQKTKAGIKAAGNRGGKKKGGGKKKAAATE